MDRKARGVMISILFLLITLQSPSPTVRSQPHVTPRVLTFTVYSDGYVFVNYHLDVNRTYPIINVTLFSETFDDLLVVDEDELPLDFSQSSNTISVSSLGSEHLRITYFTPDLTSKIGPVWSFTTEIPLNATIELPLHASIINLSGIPYLIDSQDSKVTLIMPVGLVEISYILEKQNFEPPLDYFSWVAITLLLIAIGVLAYWQINKRRGRTGDEIQQVNIEKIFQEHRDLRPEDQQALQFLTENHGRAYEAELYEKLNLPRTSTWRLIKRLEKMEIVDITKSRRQNVVHIRPEYLS